MKIAITPLVLLLLCSVSIAQKIQRGSIRRKPPVATTPSPIPGPAQPTPTPTPSNKPPAAPVPLVVVNGQTLTTADLDPALRTQLEAVEDNVAAAKRSILDLQINTIL